MASKTAVLKMDSYRRRSTRRNLKGVEVELGGRRYKCLDWTQGGLRLGGVAVELEPDLEVTGVVHLPNVAPMPLVARVAHAGDGVVGLRHRNNALDGLLRELGA